MLLIEKAIDTVYIRNMVSLYELAHWAFNKRCFEIVESQLTMAARAALTRLGYYYSFFYLNFDWL